MLNLILKLSAGLTLVLAQSPSGTVIYTENFTNVATGRTWRYHDESGHRCTHELLRAPMQTTFAHHYGLARRQVERDGEINTTTVQPTDDIAGNELGFQSFYADTLGADGSAALHSPCSNGSEVGVISSSYLVRDQGVVVNLFEIKAWGTDGLVAVCTHALELGAPTGLTAIADIYIAQAGWHEAEDEVRVWAEVEGIGAYSLLPRCNSVVTRTNIDVLGLRNPGIQNLTMGRGYWQPGERGDPAMMADEWNFTRLTVRLGTVPANADVRVCASLQSGAGAEALYIRSFSLEVSNNMSTPAQCTPDQNGTLASLRTRVVVGSCSGNSDGPPNYSGCPSSPSPPPPPPPLTLGIGSSADISGPKFKGDSGAAVVVAVAFFTPLLVFLAFYVRTRRGRQAVALNEVQVMPTLKTRTHGGGGKSDAPVDDEEGL